MAGFEFGGTEGFLAVNVEVGVGAAGQVGAGDVKGASCVFAFEAQEGAAVGGKLAGLQVLAFALGVEYTKDNAQKRRKQEQMAETAVHVFTAWRRKTGV